MALSLLQWMSEGGGLVASAGCYPLAFKNSMAKIKNPGWSCQGRGLQASAVRSPSRPWLSVTATLVVRRLAARAEASHRRCLEPGVSMEERFQVCFDYVHGLSYAGSVAVAGGPL